MLIETSQREKDRHSIIPLRSVHVSLLQRQSRIRVPAVRGVRPVGLGQGPMTAYDGGGGGGRRSIVSDSVSPWTVANQAPLSMEFSRQETAMGEIPFSRRWASGKPPASPGRTLSQMPLPQLSSGQSLSHV